jgi:chromosome segregation ATPase
MLGRQTMDVLLKEAIEALKTVKNNFADLMAKEGSIGTLVSKTEDLTTKLAEIQKTNVELLEKITASEIKATVSEEAITVAKAELEVKSAEIEKLTSEKKAIEEKLQAAEAEKAKDSKIKDRIAIVAANFEKNGVADMADEPVISTIVENTLNLEDKAFTEMAENLSVMAKSIQALSMRSKPLPAADAKEKDDKPVTAGANENEPTLTESLIKIMDARKGRKTDK